MKLERVFEAVLKEASVDWLKFWEELLQNLGIQELPHPIKLQIARALIKNYDKERFTEFMLRSLSKEDGFEHDIFEELLDDAYDAYNSGKYGTPEKETNYDNVLPSRRSSPFERTRNSVYATGNKWSIENFNATHY